MLIPELQDADRQGQWFVRAEDFDAYRDMAERSLSQCHQFTNESLLYGIMLGLGMGGGVATEPGMGVVVIIALQWFGVLAFANRRKLQRRIF